MCVCVHTVYTKCACVFVVLSWWASRCQLLISLLLLCLSSAVAQLYANFISSFTLSKLRLISAAFYRPVGSSDQNITKELQPVQ